MLSSNVVEFCNMPAGSDSAAPLSESAHIPMSPKEQNFKDCMVMEEMS